MESLISNNANNRRTLASWLTSKNRVLRLVSQVSGVSSDRSAPQKGPGSAELDWDWLVMVYSTAAS